MKTTMAFIACFVIGLFPFCADAQKSKSVVKKKTEAKIISISNKKPSSTDQLVRVKIITDSGMIILKLYDSTPRHRDNFVALVKQGFYDSLLFHRIIPGFMIQGGDPLSKNAAPGIMLGNGGSEMARIPSEFKPGLIHKRGALAAARDGNAEKASSACQFYLVLGTPVTDADLENIERNRPVKYTSIQKEIYKTQGGTPFLDQEYTVFGEIESGIEVIDKIAGVSRDQQNRPDGDIRMKLEIIK